MNWFQRLRMSHAPAATIVIRLMVGGVFFLEGLLKFLHPDELAAGRFAKIGLPWPDVLGPFVGGVEILAGALVVLGFLTRFSAVPLLIIISTAILSTKLPIVFGHGFWGFALPKLPHYGLLSMLHEARTDFCLWLGLVFLLRVGAGPWSVDAAWAGGQRRASPAETWSR